MNRIPTDDDSAWEDETAFDDGAGDPADAPDEGPDDADRARFGDTEDTTETVACPSCRADVYEQADCCPRCGAAINPHAANKPPRAVWAIVGLALAGILAWLALRY